MAKDSEIRTYIYIQNELVSQGWMVKSPAKNPSGQVYHQHEINENPVLKRYINRKVPENIIKINESKYIVLEAKPTHKQLEDAISEAKQYANQLNADKIICPICIAVAGNEEDTYIIKTFYYYRGSWKEVVINNHPVSGIINLDQAKALIRSDSYNIQELEIPDHIYYKKATKINEILHNGAINKSQRAKVLSSLLLAMSDSSEINRENSAYSLINEINAKVKTILFNYGKSEFSNAISIAIPPTPENHIKFRRAILDTIQELESINIKAAMNSGTDILGRFYERFLKYGNGAKEIGIVLTPRHITNFAAEVLSVAPNDKVFDPACGTGGFLVAAFDKVKKDYSPEAVENFKYNGLYGIEQDAEVVALALVNMIFRGDGKSNIEEGNCFTAKKFTNTKMTKVLMNPPFALKKADEKEYKFIDLALSKLEKNGLLLAVIPSTIMFRPKNYYEWRKQLLAKHTLKAVIKLPDDLFYPVGVHTSLVILQAHKPHEFSQNILWGWMKDGYIKSKGVMIYSKKAQSNLHEMLNRLKTHLLNVDFDSKDQQWIQKPLKMDALLECAPEEYLEEKPPSQEQILLEMRAVFNSIMSYKVYAN